MADKRVQLALVIHNHQPVGNFEHVIAEACDKAYLPFLRVLLDFPRIRIGLHTSGCLLEWMERGCPEYFELVRELLKRGQVELLGGGMYEPILPILPERDAFSQIERMTNYLLTHFDHEPQGMWLAERVWEPHLPEVMSKAEMNYTLLDDFHFRGCALPAQIETEFFLTGHGASRIALLPISETLRYTLPFQPVEKTFDHLRTLAARSHGLPLQVFGDDGEKFGVWPETYEWVYAKGWLRDFFTALTEALDWVDLELPVDIVRRRRSVGLVHIPCCSYKEMGEWTRVDPDATEDAPAGHWRNYLTKYSEARALYDRMIVVSDELSVAKAHHPGEDWEAPAVMLARGQCNCAYWHGVFGGLYLNNLRHALNSQLLLAEQQILSRYPRIAGADWHPQNRLKPAPPRLLNSELSVQFARSRGLTLDRIDQYDPPFVWTNVLTRRKEHYHHKLTEQHENDQHASIHDRVTVKEDGLEDRLVYDPHPRCSFNCYLAPPAASAEQFLSASLMAAGGWSRHADDYISQAQSIQHSGDSVSGEVPLGALRLLKSAVLRDDALQLNIAAVPHVPGEPDTEAQVPIPPSSIPAGNLLWVEFNFNVLTDQADDRYLVVDNERLKLSTALLCSAATGFTLCDGWQRRQLRLACSAAAQLATYPIYTVSSSEGGFERTYQGSCFMLGFDAAELAAGIAISITLEELGHAG